MLDRSAVLADACRRACGSTTARCEGLISQRKLFRCQESLCCSHGLHHVRQYVCWLTSTLAAKEPHAERLDAINEVCRAIAVIQVLMQRLQSFRTASLARFGFHTDVAQPRASRCRRSWFLVTCCSTVQTIAIVALGLMLRRSRSSWIERSHPLISGVFCA